MPKFDFSLRTRDGQLVEGIHIFGRDEADAERKLRQMYLHCEITQCREAEQQEKKASSSMDIEDMLSLIARDEGDQQK